MQKHSQVIMYHANSQYEAKGLLLTTVEEEWHQYWFQYKWFHEIAQLELWLWGWPHIFLFMWEHYHSKIAFSSPDTPHSLPKEVARTHSIQTVVYLFILPCLSPPPLKKIISYIPLWCLAWKNSTCCTCNLISSLLRVITSYWDFLILITLKKITTQKPQDDCIRM